VVSERWQRAASAWSGRDAAHLVTFACLGGRGCEMPCRGGHAAVARMPSGALQVAMRHEGELGGVHSMRQLTAWCRLLVMAQWAPSIVVLSGAAAARAWQRSGGHRHAAGKADDNGRASNSSPSSVKRGDG
jgi:hypothetical protein